jgi:hypothetical protein
MRGGSVSDRLVWITVIYALQPEEIIIKYRQTGADCAKRKFIKKNGRSPESRPVKGRCG